MARIKDGPKWRIKEKNEFGENKIREKGFPNVKIITFVKEFLFGLVLKFVKVKFTLGHKNFISGVN